MKIRASSRLLVIAISFAALADWNVTVKQLAATLGKCQVAEREKNEVRGAISGLKGDIVGR